MNIIPAAPGTVATLANGNKLSVIGWRFEEEGDHEYKYALTIRGSMTLRPHTIKEITHADGRTETPS